jgi:hypothetical protein
MSWLVVGSPLGLAASADLIFAIAYTMPEAKPIAIAETPGNVTGSWKNTKPLTAIGSLFKAPTMEYVAPDVTRTHHAEVYEIPAAPKPVTIIAKKMLFLLSGGNVLAILSADQSSKKNVAKARRGIVRRLL